MTSATDVHVPETEGQLFDQLHAQFGFFEQKPGEEWWQTKARWVGILKRVMKSRGATIKHLAVVAWWCQTPEGQSHLESPFQMFRLIPQAMGAYNRQRREQERAVDPDVLTQLAALGDQSYLERALRISEPAELEALMQEVRGAGLI